jgi:DNA-binding LacI/PurR family transcriptional regulator
MPSAHSPANTGTTIYESLAERLRESIRSGNYAPGQLLGSEHDLARKESISRMTVRRASELLINEGLLERRPGKGLYVRSTSRPATVGGAIQVIVGNLIWEPALEMSRGVQSAARVDGVHVQLYDAHGDFDQDLSLVEQLPTSGTRGAVIVSCHSPRFSQAICRLQAQNFPFVLLDHRMHDIEVSSVTADNYDGGFQIGKLLTEAGHRNIAFIGDLVAATVQDRLAGLRDAVGDAGIAFRRTMVMDLVAGLDRFGDWTEGVNEAVNKLLAADEKPTAIFCSCDAVARLAYKALATHGLSVPDDISIAGYDDDPLAEWLAPKLTSVRQPFMKMGEAAMELLRERIAKPDAPVVMKTLPVELVKRDSIAPPKRR